MMTRNYYKDTIVWRFARDKNKTNSESPITPFQVANLPWGKLGCKKMEVLPRKVVPSFLKAEGKKG